LAARARNGNGHVGDQAMTDTPTERLRNILPSEITLVAVDDDCCSGTRPCPVTFTIADVRQLRALLSELDSLRAKVAGLEGELADAESDISTLTDHNVEMQAKLAEAGIPESATGWEIVNSRGERIGPLYADKAEADFMAGQYHGSKGGQFSSAIPYRVRAFPQEPET